MDKWIQVAAQLLKNAYFWTPGHARRTEQAIATALSDAYEAGRREENKWCSDLVGSLFDLRASTTARIALAKAADAIRNQYREAVDSINRATDAEIQAAASEKKRRDGQMTTAEAENERLKRAYQGAQDNYQEAVEECARLAAKAEDIRSQLIRIVDLAEDRLIKINAAEQRVKALEEDQRSMLEEIATTIDADWRAKGGISCTEVCAIVRSAAIKGGKHGSHTN